jgi:hypothetical protein
VAIQAHGPLHSIHPVLIHGGPVLFRLKERSKTVIRGWVLS